MHRVALRLEIGLLGPNASFDRTVLSDAVAGFRLSKQDVEFSIVGIRQPAPSTLDDRRNDLGANRMDVIRVFAISWTAI